MESVKVILILITAITLNTLPSCIGVELNTHVQCMQTVFKSLLFILQLFNIHMKLVIRHGDKSKYKYQTSNGSITSSKMSSPESVI